MENCLFCIFEPHPFSVFQYEYYRLLDEKIDKIEKDVEENRGQYKKQGCPLADVGRQQPLQQPFKMATICCEPKLQLMKVRKKRRIA
jgi:hypothetical protein